MYDSAPGPESLLGSEMSELIDPARRRAEATYDEMLRAVASRAADIGDRWIASHWPFVGSDYRGLLFVGQALAGWDDPRSPAVWRASSVSSDAGRRAILEGTQVWARSGAEPIEEPLKTRSGSPFWTVSEMVANALEPVRSGPWYSRTAWWNLFPLGWARPNGSPSGPLWMAQEPSVPELFWSVVEMLKPTRIVILAGSGYWQTAKALGLADLGPRTWPTIAGGRRDGRTIVWTRHPGGHYRGVTRADFARAVAQTVTQIDQET